MTKKLQTGVNNIDAHNGANILGNQYGDNLGEALNNNANLINQHFNGSFSYGDDSIISEILNPDTTIDQIKNIGFNIGELAYNNQLDYFKRKCDNLGDDIKQAIIASIHDKLNLGQDNNSHSIHKNPAFYIQDIIESLGTNAEESLKDCKITINDINNNLPDNKKIAPGTLLSAESIQPDVKKALDTMISFEYGNTIDSIKSEADKINETVISHFSNAIPGINTILGSGEYKYNPDECKEENFSENFFLNKNEYDNFRQRIEGIKDDSSISEEVQSNRITWLCYIEIVKKKNRKLGNFLQDLFDNNFDYAKTYEKDKDNFKAYIKEISNIYYNKIKTGDIKEFLKYNLGGDIDGFKAYYDDLINLGSKTINFNSNLQGLEIPVTKAISHHNIARLEDINQSQGNNKLYDQFPIDYIIKKSDIDSMPISDDDKSELIRFLSGNALNKKRDVFTISGNEIGKLFLLYNFFNGTNHKERVNEEVENNISKSIDDATSESSEDPDDTPDKFIEGIEALGNGNTKFENGAEIWLPIGNSELPGGGKEWMKIQINNVDSKNGTFEGKVFGGELQFSSKIEGKSRKLKMNHKSLESIKDLSSDKNSVLLLPNPSIHGFGSYQQSLGGKLSKSMDFKLPKWESDHFIHNVKDEDGEGSHEEVVEYFGSQDGDPCQYRIKYNPHKRIFNVSSSFIGDEQDQPNKGKVKYSYERDMDRNNFLIFITSKKLVPKTKEEANAAADLQLKKEIPQGNYSVGNGGHWRLHWKSINDIKSVFKSIKSKLKNGIDAHNKASAEELEDIVIGDRGLYDKLAGLLGFIPSVKSAIGAAQQEYYNDRDNRARKEIDGYLKSIQSDPNFPNTFGTVPPHIKTIWGNSYKNFIINAAQTAEHKELNRSEKRKAAALLLANIEKGGSPYRGLAEQENQGLWVKILLGNTHYKQFLIDKEACIRARDEAESKKSDDDKKSLNNALSSCELDYIINNIRGAYSGLPNERFGSIERNGLNGNKSTEYIDNPAKRILSEQFAGKLESAKNYFSKDSVEEKYSSIKKLKSFNKAEDEFSKTRSTRYQNGEGALRAMMDMASNDTLKRRVKKHFIEYLLSGALDIYCNPDIKKQVYGWAKPAAFVPALLVKDAGVAENVATLLDAASKGDFSKHVTKYFHRNDHLNGSHGNFSQLKSELSSWLTDDRMVQLDKYFEDELPFEDFDNYNISEDKKNILKKFQNALLSNNPEEFDRSVMDNPTMVNNGLISSAEIVRSRLKINRTGGFDGKDSDENNNLQQFWEKITKSIESKKEKANDPKTVKFVLNQFFNRFGLNSYRQETYQWIQTAYHYKDRIGKERRYKYTSQGKVLNMGITTQKEIDSILWYAFKGRVWSSIGSGSNMRIPPEINEALNAFQNFFKEAFKCNTLQNDDIITSTFETRRLDTDKPALLLGSWATYRKFCSTSGGNYNDEEGDAESNEFNSEKERRTAYRNTYLSNERFINSKILRLEQNFKNKSLPESDFISLSIDDNEDIMTRVEEL